MDLINFITDTDFGLKTKTDNFDGWNVRQPVRAVLFNDKNEVALMHIGKYDVYKLPGGGVDQGEDLEKCD